MFIFVLLNVHFYSFTHWWSICLSLFKDSSSEDIILKFKVASGYRSYVLKYSKWVGGEANEHSWDTKGLGNLEGTTYHRYWVLYSVKQVYEWSTWFAIKVLQLSVPHIIWVSVCTFASMRSPMLSFVPRVRSEAHENLLLPSLDGERKIGAPEIWDIFTRLPASYRYANLSFDLLSILPSWRSDTLHICVLHVVVFSTTFRCFQVSRCQISNWFLIICSIILFRRFRKDNLVSIILMVTDDLWWFVLCLHMKLEGHKHELKGPSTVLCVGKFLGGPNIGDP